MQLLQRTLFIGLLISASHAIAGQLGRDGRDGENGASGRSGYDGRDREVVLDGRPQSVELSATDGSDGYDAYDGRDATGCGQDKVAEDLYGANGGRGGNGGNGGAGGHAGKLTIRYTDPSQLKNLSIRAVPGRAGFGGRAGRGGRGCACTYTSWTIEIDGQSKTYRCSDGSDGSNGYEGSRGENGGVYIPTLIPSLSPVPADYVQASFWAKDFPAQPVQLTRNYWEQKRGLLALLAPNSHYIDTYNQLVKTLRHQFAFKWLAPTPISQYPRAVVEGSLGDQGFVSKIVLNAASTWAGVTETVSGDLTTLTVDSTFTTADVRKLASEGFTGSGRSIALALKDSSGADRYIKNRVFLTLFQKVNGRYYQKYNAYLRDDLVSKSYNGDTMFVNFGQELSIPEAALQVGSVLNAQILVERHVAGNYVARVDFKSEFTVK